MDSLWGFQDGMIQKTAHLLYNQRTIYTMFKKCHGITFYSVLVPDGYLAFLFGPVPANTRDARLLCENNLIQQLRNVMPEDNCNGPIYSFCGDLTYPQSAYLLGRFWNAIVGTDDANFNRHLSSVCITLEWGYCKIIEQWKYLDLCQAMRFFQSPVAQYYVNTALLCNLRNCLIGNKTRNFFNAHQMTIEEDLVLVTHS